MSFLAPLFLAGAFAVALPVIFHLIRRSTRERTVFSSLMFLMPSPPKLSRRRRLEHILLLLLRCTAIILLATGFARPFFKSILPHIQSAAAPKRLLVLLDTSASMRRQNLWNAAIAKVEATISHTGPADQVAIFAFDRQLKPLVSFEEWNASAAGDRASLVRSRLAEIKPGWSSTRLDTALIRAAEILAESDKEAAPGARSLVLITDLQEGSQLRALQGHEWPKGIEVVTERISPRPGSNAGIQLVTDTADAEYVADSTVRVRISSASDSKREQLQAGWAGPDERFVAKPLEVYVPAGQSRVVTVPMPGTNVAADRILLRGDDEPFDNTVFVIPPAKTRINVLYFGADQNADIRQPFFFLNRALQQTRRQEVRIKTRDPAVPLPVDEVQAATLLVTTGELSDSEAGAIRDAVAQGKTLLFAPATSAAASGLGKILGLGSLAVDEKQPANYAMLGQIDFRHPLFAPFADPRFSDFTKIHFWKYRRLDTASLPNARVIAQFDTGDPALLEIPLGKGRVIALASCWHPADSQLALSSKFVPLLYSLLEFSGASTPSPQQYFVGDSIILPPDTAKRDSPASIQLPDGSKITLRAGETNFTQTLSPGVYSLASDPPARFAVNLDGSESRTAPLAMDELERLGVPAVRSAPVATTEAARQVRLQNAELESRQKLWRWFILVTLAVLGLETWLAGRTARRTLLPKESAS